MPSPIERLLLLLLALCPLGCGILERAACGEPCKADPIAVEGSPEDFTRDRDPADGVQASRVAACEADDEVMYTVVSTEGEATDAGAWAGERLVPALVGAQLRASWNIVQCASFEGPTYNVLDWREVDAVVDLVGELAREDGVSVEIAITIGPEPGSCPSIGCGY